LIAHTSHFGASVLTLPLFSLDSPFRSRIV
jgi:hypothetical protein